MEIIIEYAGDTGTPTNLTSSQMGGPGPEGWRSYELANIEVIHYYLSAEEAIKRYDMKDKNRGGSNFSDIFFGSLFEEIVGLFPGGTIISGILGIANNFIPNKNDKSFHIFSGTYIITIAKYYIVDACGEYKMRGEEPEILARYKITYDPNDRNANELRYSDVNCDWRTYNCYDSTLDQKVRNLQLF